MIDEYEVAELKAEAALERRYKFHLAAHPSCRDPEHPGCWKCEDTEGEDDAL